MAEFLITAAFWAVAAAIVAVPLMKLIDAENAE